MYLVNLVWFHNFFLEFGHRHSAKFWPDNLKRFKNVASLVDIMSNDYNLIAALTIFC